MLWLAGGKQAFAGPISLRLTDYGRQVQPALCFGGQAPRPVWETRDLWLDRPEVSRQSQVKRCALTEPCFCLVSTITIILITELGQ